LEDLIDVGKKIRNSGVYRDPAVLGTQGGKKTSGGGEGGGERAVGKNNVSRRK